MNPQQRLALLGAITLIRLQRDKLDQMEAGVAELLESFGATVPDPSNRYDTVLSAVQEWMIEERPAEEILDLLLGRLEFEEAVSDAA